MDYVVLARKLRPTRFSELIGQETVARALRNAVTSGRVAHAFLFAGSRGVGKTSAARILTKALNCLAPQEGEPCNGCENCREITANAAPDVFEIDAASNRGIDNIRELRENTRFTPVKCPFKTYIIDEVHMLTTESFNALLKTLEEPPQHVKFILATTSPHKIPETILSRCQRYDFSRISIKVMADHLMRVMEREGLGLSRNALERIARNSAGGMRDALTMVDQVVAFAGPKAEDAQVFRVLGLMDNREVFNLLGAILEKSLPRALQVFAELQEHGHDLNTLLESMIREVKDFALFLTLGREDPTFAEYLGDTLNFYESHKARSSLDELQQLFYLLLEVEGQIKRSDFAKACFEMGLVKACRVQPLVGVPELLAQARGMLSRAAGSSSTLAPRGPARDERTSSHTTPASLAAGATPMRGRERSAPDRPPANDGDEGEEAEPGPGIQSAAGEPRLEILGIGVATPSSEAPNPIPPPYPSQSPRKPDPSLTGDTPGGRNASERGDSSLSLQTSEDMEPAGEDARQTPLFMEEPSSELASVAAAPDGGLSMASGASTPGEGGAPWPEAAPPERVAEFLEEPAEALESPQGIPAPGAGSILDPRGAAPPQADPQPGAQTPPGTGRSSKSPSPGSRPSSPAGAGGASPEGSPFTAADFELLREAAPCDDPRWREFVERASAQNRRAAAQLRRMDVLALHADAVELALPDPTAALSPQNLEELQPLLHQVFGAAFQLRLNNGKTGKTRPAFTIAGRNRLAEEARRAARRKDAEEDPLVKSLQRVFPKSRVVEVRLKETNPPDRSEDVQGKSG